MNISTPAIRAVGQRFISIDFPSERIIASLGAELRSRCQDNVLIINMSERDYDTELLPGHVLNVNFRGLPAPPLELLCRLCLQIHQWIARSPVNMVAVHCFPGLSRTAVLICCYLAWSGVCVHPVDSLVDVCAGLKIDVEANPILPSQKRYMNYFFDFLTNPAFPQVPAKSLGISKLILNGVPNLPLSDDALFRPFIEVWQDGHLICTSLPGSSKDMQIEELVASVPSYSISRDSISNEISCVSVFDKFEELVLSGDLLFRVRHLSSKGGRFTCMRFAFNTNHVSNNMLHFGQLELDGNGFNDCMIDVVFNPSVTPVTSSEDSERARDIFLRAKQVGDKLRQGCDVSDAGSDIEEVIMLRKVIAHSSGTAPPQVIGRPEPIPENNEPINTANALPATVKPKSTDEVDDFFAQLERDAQI